jgi:hypothetical protein
MVLGLTAAGSTVARNRRDDRLPLGFCVFTVAVRKKFNLQRKQSQLQGFCKHREQLRQEFPVYSAMAIESTAP